MIQVYKWNGTVINFDNAYDAAKFASDNPDAEELDSEEIANVFGDYPHLAGPDTTTVDGDGSITFTLPDEYSDLEIWLQNNIRPTRDALLVATDFLYRSDIESKMSDDEMAIRDIYCQELRDFPASFQEIVADFGGITWPAKPSFMNVRFE
jgi:hypothetical protein